MEKFKYVKVLSENLRYGTKRQREALLKWVNLAKFKKRKPTPAELVRECKRKGSRLYGLMKVSQKKAAESYWRQTAQDILRHIDLVRVDMEINEVVGNPVKAWMPIKIEACGRIPEDSYVPTPRIVNNPGMKGTVIDRAHREFLAWLQRWENHVEFMQEFSPILEAYKKIRKRLDDVA